MKTFTIDTENHITVFTRRKQMPQQDGGVAIFSTAEELGATATDWPAARLPAIWNSLPGVKPVHKFTDRKTAARRIHPGTRSRAGSGSQQEWRQGCAGAAGGA